MKLLALCLCLVLALSRADGHHQEGHHHAEVLDRCEGLEMDAVALDDSGAPYFFKGEHLFEGFHGKAELSNETFAELDEHHNLSHVDAAFSMHVNGSDHPHMFLFLDHNVFVYCKHKLEKDMPKDIQEEFPGIPNHLDAAVECPKPDCGDDDMVIFFKGDEIFHYNLNTKAVEEKEFESMPNCTSAFRFLGSYYCFHGHLFSKFDPKTGDVHGRYPKEAREYFARCPNFGDNTNHTERERCTHVHLDAITIDQDGNLFAFRGHHFIHNKVNVSIEADTVENAFKELHSEVDAVFSYENQLYMIKDDEVFLYKIGQPHTLLDGYPKSLKDEFGIEGHLDAAFVVGNSDIAHVIQGQKMFDVDLKASTRKPTNERHFSVFEKVDGVMSHDGHVIVAVGNHIYKFESTEEFLAATAAPEQLGTVSKILFHCDH